MQNIVILAGNIGQNPEVRNTQGGTKITNFTLATSRPRLSEGRAMRDENGYRVMDTEWHRITCFNGLGKTVADNCEKGMLDTLFGRFEVKAPRIRRCACNAKPDVVLGGPLSPLAHFFPDRSTPELRRLQAELGARHSFREAARILETFLPCAKQVNTSVRNRLGKVAREICGSEQTEPLVPSSCRASLPVAGARPRISADRRCSWRRRRHPT